MLDHIALPTFDLVHYLIPKFFANFEVRADTLFRLLHQLEPSKMHYLGSPAAGRDGTFFAYGGAGFVLSHGLMKRLVGDSTQLSALYEDYAINDCCGDAALGYAIMNKTGAPLQALYPTFAGDELNGLKVNGDRWCIPLLGLHRVTPEQMKSLWEWERTRPYDQVCSAVIFISFALQQLTAIYSIRLPTPRFRITSYPK